ncbi:hypothetical protein ACN2XU_23870 [Primorskyibacter sp. 2E107]|uniref:hypothetical protein n=1 Tax=Primorskyibacter sp. 2E107 TaxID=3403458 RepID=UPI003AF5C3D9
MWRRDDEEVARIAYRAEQGQLVLNYRVSLHGSECEPISETICITRADCHLGGARPYFICPGVIAGHACNRRVGKLFAGGRYFLCRHCYDVAYGSQSEARFDRMLRRANKLRTALGGNPGTANFIAPKPKGIWTQTYAQRCFEIEWCECEADREFIWKYRHLLGADDLRTYLEE